MPKWIRIREAVFFSIMPEAVIIHDGERILFCNPATVRMYGGNDINDLVGTNQDHLVHPDELAWLKRRRKQTAKLGAKAPSEATRCLRLDGTVFYAENTSVGIEYQGARAFMILSRDVTDRINAESALRKSEERYHALVNSQKELITQFTPDGLYTFVNKAVFEFVGKSTDSLKGSLLYKDVPEQEIDALKANFAKLSPEQPYNTFKNRVMNAKGEARIYEWSNLASFDDSHQIIEIQSVGRDITDRKMAEQALAESEERYRSLVDVSPEAIVVVDDNIVVYANPAAAGMFGTLASDEFFGSFFPAPITQINPIFHAATI